MKAESIKAKLKNLSDESGRPFQELLTYYGLERTLYRISISPYADHFILKGGILLYALYDRQYERVTTDIDLLAQRVSNRREEMLGIFSEILSQNIDDALKYDLSSLIVKNIADFKEYHGLNVTVVACLDRTRIAISIDIGYGDIIIPEPIQIDFPVLLELERPKLTAYSIESVIAEKLEAIVANGMLNSRYKDFYDLYIITKTKIIHEASLRHALRETFLHRGTTLPERIPSFESSFTEDAVHRLRWLSFVKKKKAMIKVPLEVTAEWLNLFFTLILMEGTQNRQWHYEDGQWL